MRVLGHRLRELYNHSNAQAKGLCMRSERRSAARRNCYLPLNRSRRISTPRESRSTGRSGRRGRSIHELTITDWGKTRTRDCLPSKAGRCICVSCDHRQALWLTSKPAKLAPLFKSALTQATLFHCPFCGRGGWSRLRSVFKTGFFSSDQSPLFRGLGSHYVRGAAPITGQFGSKRRHSQDGSLLLSLTFALRLR